MKNTFTPFWLAVSLMIGLSTLYFSTKYLFGSLVNEPLTIIVPSDTVSFSDRIKLISTHPSTIDTLKYNQSYLDSIKVPSIDIIKNNFANINNRAFLNLKPALLRWLIFHIVALTFCLTSVLFILFLISQIWTSWKDILELKYIGIIMIVALFIFFGVKFVGRPLEKVWNGIQIMENFYLIFRDPAKAVRFILHPMQYVSLLPVIGMLLINLRTYHVFEARKETPTGDEFVKLKNTLNIFAFYLGLLVSCAVIGTGLQRDMIIAQNEDFAMIYTEEMIYAYGIGYSVILALIFVPSYAYLIYAGNEYRKQAESEEVDGKTRNWMRLSKETIDNLKLTFSIILPLLTSIVQPILGK